MAALVSAAQRRKQRRLRSWWRHEQQSIAAVLATVSHHSHSKVDTANAALRGQKIGSEVGPAEFFELFSDDGRPTGRVRPAALFEPRPQGEVQRHAGIGYELAQNLDVPVLVDQLPNVLPVLRQVSAGGCRAGYRRAQDLTGQDSASAWGTVCANRRRRTSWWKCPRSFPMLLYSSRLLLLMVAAIVAAGEVFKGYD